MGGASGILCLCDCVLLETLIRDDILRGCVVISVHDSIHDTTLWPFVSELNNG